jgi:hypothetical protein
MYLSSDVLWSISFMVNPLLQISSYLRIQRVRIQIEYNISTIN